MSDNEHYQTYWGRGAMLNRSYTIFMDIISMHGIAAAI